jgi:ribose-phosphate pyrophosphokinase
MKKTILFLILAIVTTAPLLAFEKVNVSSTDSTVFEDQVAIFTGNSNTQLAREVAQYLDMPLGNAVVSKFNDGEIQIHIDQSVRNKDIFIIQPTCHSDNGSINDNMMELYLLVRTMKRSSAASITAIIPYYGYARQDRKTAPRVPISASDIALLLETAGVDRVVTVDLHCGQIQGFFHNAPVDNLYAATVFVPYFAKKDLKNVVIVSPDAGGVERAKRFMENLGKLGIPAKLAIISKQRAKAGVVDTMNLIGDVTNADAIIVDDLCDTGGTLVLAAKLLKDSGANRVYAAITHPVFFQVRPWRR